MMIGFGIFRGRGKRAGVEVETLGWVVGRYQVRVVGGWT